MKNIDRTIAVGDKVRLAFKNVKDIYMDLKQIGIMNNTRKELIEGKTFEVTSVVAKGNDPMVYIDDKTGRDRHLWVNMSMLKVVDND